MWGHWWQGICISADKAFCSETVFTEPFRLPSARGGMGPAFIMHRESSLIWGIASALFSPPRTPIHTHVQLCSPRQRETKLPLMLQTDGNKMVTFVQRFPLKDLPCRLRHRQTEDETACAGGRIRIYAKGGLPCRALTSRMCLFISHILQIVHPHSAWQEWAHSQLHKAVYPVKMTESLICLCTLTADSVPIEKKKRVESHLHQRYTVCHLTTNATSRQTDFKEMEGICIQWIH